MNDNENISLIGLYSNICPCGENIIYNLKNDNYTFINYVTFLHKNKNNNNNNINFNFEKYTLDNKNIKNWDISCMLLTMLLLRSNAKGKIFATDYLGQGYYLYGYRDYKNDKIKFSYTESFKKDKKCDNKDKNYKHINKYRNELYQPDNDDLKCEKCENAARIIQNGCHNWLFKPVCKDGKIGIVPRLSLKNLNLI